LSEIIDHYKAQIYSSYANNVKNIFGLYLFHHRQHNSSYRKSCMHNIKLARVAANSNSCN